MTSPDIKFIPPLRGHIPLDEGEARMVALLGLGIVTTIERGSDGSLTPAPMISGHVGLAEGIRTLLWVLSGYGKTAVHTNRILCISRSLAVLFGLNQSEIDSTKLAVATPNETAAERFRYLDDSRLMLDDLAAIGDITYLSGGWWLPGSFRLVTLPGNRDLILGGPPVTWWPEGWRGALEMGGLGRIVDRNTSVLESVPRESFDEWVRSSTAPVDQEARQFLDHTSLQANTLNESRIMAYAPVLSPLGSPQGFRWQYITPRLPNGRYLLRLETARGRSMLIGLAESGHVIATSEPISALIDVRRLQYGIDLLAGRPTTVTITTTGARALAQVALQSTLPRAELRLLAAVGRLLQNPTGRYYPRIWEVAAGSLSSIRQRLHVLGANLCEQVNASDQSCSAGARV